MPRGRPRTKAPNFPANIDHERVPAGIYWDRSGAGRWTLRELDADGKLRHRTVAGPDARLSDLYAIAEAHSGVDRKSLRGLLAAFHASAEFNALKKPTRDDYGYCRDRVLEQRTRLGGSFGDLETARITRPVIQRLVDVVAQGRKRNKAGELIPTPSTAVHVLRYLRRAYRWGCNRGWAAENPAVGIEPPRERKARRMPQQATFAAVLAYAREHAGVRGVAGHVAPYLADVAEIAYLCRLRGVEVIVDLNDADVLEAGLQCRRRKGSRTNVTRWDPRLRAAVDRLVERRNALWQQRRMPVPMRPEDRPLVVSTTGHPLARPVFNKAWRRMILGAIAAGVIAADERFSLHGLKHRGITDTQGTRGEKQQASGHRQEAMLDVYDHEVPVVDSAASSLPQSRKRP